MRARFFVLGALCVPIFAVACSSATIEGPDASSPDASEASKVDQGAPDVAADVTNDSSAIADTSTDAPNDVAELDAAADAAPDVILDAGGGLEGGNICPGIGLCGGACSCDAGYKNQWHVMAPDGGINYLCESGQATTNPECPSGWICSGFNSANQFVSKTCP